MPNAVANHFSLIVIGGGINGAGIAQCAAASGYSTLLVEKQGWGAGTSSKSSKLIHGGLRYLESGQLKMVYESLHERKHLQSNAPDLVKPNTFYIPVYRNSTIKPWKLFAGLSLYYLLSGFSKQNRFHLVDRKVWQALPLSQENLQQVFSYTDCQTNDQELTRAVVNSAKQLGATLLCPAQMNSAYKTNSGYHVEITANSKTDVYSCDLLINASGPWVNEVAGNIQPSIPTLPIDLIQGSHLVLTPQLHNQCFYLEAPTDGRWIFALPWMGKTLLGTTETPYNGNPEQTICLPQEREYLLSVLQHYFPNFQPTVEDSMAGLRVLPQAGSSVHHRSREVVIVSDNSQAPAYLGVYAGKLTTYRSTAEKVVTLAAKTLGQGFRKGITKNIAL